MKVFCITSDKYRHLLRGFAEKFNFFWGDEQDVIVLGYLPPIESLAHNFYFHSLGRQDDFGSSWTDGLRPYFEKVHDEKFIVMLEDYYLNRPVCSGAVDYLGLKFRDPNIVKIELTRDGLNYPVGAELERGLSIRAQNARYRSSLQAAIWRRDYFYGLLKESRTPWEFELKGERELMNDGKMILIATKGILFYDNMSARKQV